ncbi:MAG: oligosaccharide flippase family protein, partial [candidate division Zixibacteria bacterium]|nr:oligosaccharide flippase family protein [candidate division Zixibacteria bacterium]
MNFFSSTVTTLVARFFSITCGVLTEVLTARALGPEGRGILAVIISTSAIGVTLGLAGLAEANTYLVAGDRNLSRRLTANSLWTALATGILADGIIVSVYLISPSVFESIPFEFLLVGLISVPFIILGILIQRIYLGQNRIVMFNAYELLTRALILVATFTVLYLLKMQLYTYLLTYAAIFAASSVYFFFRQEIDLKSIVRPDFALLKSSLGYGWRAYAATLLPFFLSRVGLYFVNAQIGADHAGYYSVAMQANDLFLIVPGVLGMLLFPRVAANKSDSTLTLKTFRFTLMLMLPIFVIAQIFTEQIVVILFGVEFLPAVTTMRVLFVGGFVSGLGLIIAHDLAGRGY